MEFNYNDYLLEDFSLSDTNKIKIKKTIKIKYNIPIIKKKIVRNIISRLYNDQTSLYQIRNSFYEFISDNLNIMTILTNIHKLLKFNINIFDSIDELKYHLKKQSDPKNIVFKYSYFNKVYDGSNPLELYFYHNCLIIYLFICNKIKLSLNTNVFDKNIANVALESIKTMILFLKNSPDTHHHLVNSNKIVVHI